MCPRFHPPPSKTPRTNKVTEAPARWRKREKKKVERFFLNESINLWSSDSDRETSKEGTNTPPGCLFCNAERERSRHRARRRRANTDMTLTHSRLRSYTGGGRRAHRLPAVVVCERNTKSSAFWSRLQAASKTGGGENNPLMSQ